MRFSNLSNIKTCAIGSRDQLCINPQVKEQYEEKNQKHQELSSSYNHLLEQKIEIDKQLQEYY